MLTKFLVWCFRILTGATFVFSGFSKAIDPWGTMYKIIEYLSAWGLDGIPREAIFCVSVGLAMLEFVSGAMLMLGCMRKSICGILAIIMAFMLPLTIYIYFASPVDDCGCFGDAWVLSNGATLLKNIILTAMIIYLLPNNDKAGYLYPPLMQWIVAIICIAYCLTISLFGIAYQPIVDFRPYKVGTNLIEDDDMDDAMAIYQKDGQEKAFSVYQLPDTTWTFVKMQLPAKTNKMFAIFDGDEEVTQDVIVSQGPQMLYLVSNPKRHNRARASMANHINQKIVADGGSMIGIIAADSLQLARWKSSAHPSFDVYTTDDTLIKELARGDAALVYLKDGVIQWKRNLYSFSSDYPGDSDDFDSTYVVDSGQLAKYMTLALILLLLLLYAFGLLEKIGKHHK